MEFKKIICISFILLTAPITAFADWLPERTIDGVYFGVSTIANGDAILVELDAPIGYPGCEDAEVIVLYGTDYLSFIEKAFENQLPLEINDAGPNAMCSPSGLSITEPYVRFLKPAADPV